jgi:hypothetical protein
LGSIKVYDDDNSDVDSFTEDYYLPSSVIEREKENFERE